MSYLHVLVQNMQEVLNHLFMIDCRNWFNNIIYIYMSRNRGFFNQISFLYIKKANLWYQKIEFLISKNRILDIKKSILFFL